MVHAPVRNLPRIVAFNAAAARRGVTVGMPLAEAEALLEGNPLIAPCDAAADRAQLRKLAVLCDRFGPITGLEDGESPESLLIDVTGCGPFFGGELELARQAMHLLAERRYFARAGLAETVGLAWAASRTLRRERMTLVAAHESEAWFSSRPIAALRLDRATISLLGGLGLRTVGDVLQLPRTELPSRFGPLLLRRIDQALGRLAEPIEPVRPAVPLMTQWRAETPLTDRTTLAVVLARLIAEIVKRLPLWEGIMSLACGFNAAAPVVVGAALPARSAERLMALVTLALDRQPPPYEVEQIVIVADTVRLPPPDRTDLFGDRTSVEQDRLFSRLIERLSGRLGPDAVSRPMLAGDHLPEHAVQAVPITVATPPSTIERRTVEAIATRPILLRPEPEPVSVLSVHPDGPPFRLTRGKRMNTLVLAFGPERFETAWADAPEARRDYWRVETDEAERLWLFRCRRSGAWFLHGLFG